MAVEPFFKTFHMRIEYTISRLKQLDIDDISRAYVGIILNGNWVKTENSYKISNRFLKMLYKILQKIY